MSFIIAFLVHCVVLCLLILPLLMGDAHPLEDHYGLGWEPSLLAMKQQMIIERYAHQQTLYEEGRLAASSWRKLKKQLQARYIAIARRLELLEAEERADAAGGAHRLPGEGDLS